MPLPIELFETMNSVKNNIILLSYISSKYVLEILSSMIIILSYISMFISYGLMTISNKIHIFINITYNDFGEYELDKFVEKSIKKFYTKFPSMKKYFVEPTIKQEFSPTFPSKNEIVDLTEDSDSEEEEENEINEPSADDEEELEYTEEEIVYNKIDDVMFNKKCLNTDIKKNVKLAEEEVENEPSADEEEEKTEINEPSADEEEEINEPSADEEEENEPSADEEEENEPSADEDSKSEKKGKK